MLLLALFLPYQYQPGGNFVVYPLQKSEITPDVKGIVTKVHFDGGESLTKGTPIAEIKDDDNLAKLQEFAAKVREQEAVVHNLKTLPKPEAVKLAEAELETAITQEEYSREKVPRLKGLYEQHAVSFDEYDLVRKQHDVDIDQVTEKRANLELVKTGPTPDEIAAAEARLKSLEAQRDGYQDKVNRSVLYMPFDGHILTLHLQDRIGSYLEKGAFFAAVENTSKVTVEIDVPEDQIWPVSVGQEVYARPQAYNDEDFEGKVTTIDHNVTVQPTGNIVKVIATVDNEGGQLKTGMTGYAKVEGPTMPVWEAFSVEMRRFFNIDVWSWVP
jgi:putative peptide zinc metalloprotease protein